MFTEHYYGFEPDENYDPDFPEPDEEVIDWDEDAYWDTVADR